jgi:16S rRNA (cytosine967-C5)-methyltransferase
VQDEAAGLVVAMLDPQPGETVLDACAAPGGKALLAAARMRGRGLLLALDASRRRLASLRRAAEGREHGGVLRTRAADLRDFATQRFVPHAAPSEEERAAMERGGGGGGSDPERRHPWQYDRVLLDAPCSGTGVLSKRADLRWRRTPADVRQLAGLQGELLDAAAALVAPGGLLVYATCSLEHQENQAQVAAFLQRHPGFQLEAPPPSAGVPTQCLDARGCLAMLPHVHGTDGAFAARLRRRNSGGGEDKGGGGTETAA